MICLHIIRTGWCRAGPAAVDVATVHLSIRGVTLNHNLARGLI